MKQGCELSLDLFSLYSEKILRNVKFTSGIKVGGRIINNITFTDDTVFIAESEKDLQNIMDVRVNSGEEKGLNSKSKRNKFYGFNQKCS